MFFVTCSYCFQMCPLMMLIVQIFWTGDVYCCWTATSCNVRMTFWHPRVCFVTDWLDMHSSWEPWCKDQAILFSRGEEIMHLSSKDPSPEFTIHMFWVTQSKIITPTFCCSPSLCRRNALLFHCVTVVPSSLFSSMKKRLSHYSATPIFQWWLALQFLCTFWECSTWNK